MRPWPVTLEWKSSAAGGCIALAFSKLLQAECTHSRDFSTRKGRLQPLSKSLCVSRECSGTRCNSGSAGVRFWLCENGMV
jgi:hypothetical protein